MQLTELQRFQSTHRNHLGLPLDVDNVLGPETRWAKDFETLCIERRTVIEAAQPFIYPHGPKALIEKPFGSNDEPTGTIDRWLKASHAQEGDPWCAASVSEWLSTVIPVRIAGAVRLGKHFPVTATPWAGDIGWYPTNTKGNGHVFLVIGVDSHWVMSIEGNCDHACRCVRRPRVGLRFARTFEDVSGICPKVILSVPLAGSGTR